MERENHNRKPENNIAKYEWENENLQKGGTKQSQHFKDIPHWFVGTTKHPGIILNLWMRG